MTLRKQHKAGRSKLAKATKQLDSAELFFYKYAGYSYDPKTQTPEQGRIECAKALAKAEVYAIRHDWQFIWDYDDIPYEDALGDHEYWCEDARQGRHHEHEILWCQCCDADGRVLASLGAIIDPDTNSRRVIQAELALESGARK